MTRPLDAQFFANGSYWKQHRGEWYKTKSIDGGWAWVPNKDINSESELNGFTDFKQLADWSNAPADATHYADGKFWKKNKNHYQYYIEDAWYYSSNTLQDLKCHPNYDTQPIAEPVPDLPIGQIDYVKETMTEFWARAGKTLPPVTPPLVTNKYDRTIVGKYGSGQCVVDVYRVLDAFKTDNAAIDHAIKKLLCAGLRGDKDRNQDWLEAVQSINAALQLVEDKGNVVQS